MEMGNSLQRELRDALRQVPPLRWAKRLSGKASVSTRTRFEKHGVVETVIRKLS